ncbi:ankyrin repeat L25 [Fusarium mundagurra]|uniref:Ankyrin repeat L25 n=1 Tax=Fusarium mundagurra TaxID=1567541 RepID=A0A8H6DM99_9HYPO|nr:ankyrin repeat L25 [Fusarium mundagurra]
MPGAGEYTIGWICALSKELIAARAFLDVLHEPVDNAAINDDNKYTLGSIGKHNVVIAVLPYGQYGLVNAATTLKDMTRTFSNLRAVLMVGVGGGVPGAKDIRLGDIVVGSVGRNSSGVIQYDYGRAVQGQEFAVTGHLNQPPMAFLTAMSALHARYEMEGHDIESDIDKALQKYKRLGKKYKKPNASTDRLYKAEFIHQGGEGMLCSSSCGDGKLVHRDERDEDENNPAIHHGLIASGNSLMKDAYLRDKLAAKYGILCFEMEAAGLMNHFPCVVIRGICDYSDSHKNDEWQAYAAMAAAAYTKDLLLQVAPSSILKEERIETLLGQLSEMVNDIRQIASESKGYIKSLSSSIRDDAISRWLQPADPSTDHNKARQTCHLGSGQWLLDNPQYLTWKSNDNSFLWLKGDSGTGKTIITSTVIEDIQHTLHHCAILYFYITFTDSQKQTLEAILRSLIDQLYRKCPKARHLIKSLHSKSSDGGRQPAVEQLKSTFHDMLAAAGEVFILIDALDEYQSRSTQRDELMSWLESFSNKPVKTHLLVTSRPEHGIKTSLETWVNSDSIISLKTDSVDRDIHEYVLDVVTNSTGFRRWYGRTTTQDVIVNTLTAKADGVFRWVALQLERLRDCISKEEVDETLETLPATLQETYFRVLRELRGTRRRYVIRLLQVLAYSDLPLELEAAVDALAINLAAPPGSRFIMEDRSKTYYNLLLNKWRHGAKGLQLAHSSVKEFILSCSSNELNVLSSHQISGQDQLFYASWSGDEDCVKELLEGNAIGDTSSWKLDPALLIASECGYSGIVALLIREGADVNAKGRIHNVLCSAVKGGNPDVVALLIKEGADLDAQQGIFNISCEYGRLDIVIHLMKKGVDVNTQTDSGAAFQATLCSDYSNIVTNLLEKGAIINAQGGIYGTALYAASWYAYLNFVAPLVEEGADMNAQRGDYINEFRGDMERQVDLPGAFENKHWIQM